MAGDTRKIKFEGITNARDLGGLRTAGGKAVRRGRLIRSANLSGASASDIARLKDDYDLRLVIDLRTPMAERMKPDVRIEGVAHQLIPVFDDAMIGITHESDRDYARRTKPMPDLRDLYRMMVTEEVCLRKFNGILTRIMSLPEGSCLWHCSEGKDRCGLVTMFLLCALEVPWESILEDYLLTNEAAFARADDFYRQVLRNSGDEKVAASVRDAFIVKKEYLESAVTAIREGYEDILSFLIRGIRVPESLIRDFRARMLV